MTASQETVRMDSLSRFDSSKSATRGEKRLERIALALFLLSIVGALLRIEQPNYGGDELWFATPLVRRSAANLDLFQFEYAGPIKTLLTWPIFEVAGFSVVSLRLFTLATFVATVAVWFSYLHHRALPVAAAATVAFFALNPDLQFFARVDINQPTLHDLIMLLHLVAFLVVVERGPTLTNSLAFLVLSFVDVNSHIRNIWVANALVLAFLADHASLNGISRRSALSAIRRGWPIALGWAIGAAEFAYVLHRFEGSAGLESAKALATGITWEMRARQVADALPQLASGGRVLATGYDPDVTSTTIGGLVILVATIAALAAVPRAATRPDMESRLLRILLVVWFAVTVQFALTKSARWAWHGNGVILFWATTFGLVVQSLWGAGRRKFVGAYAALVFVTFAAHRVTLERAIETTVSRKSGFELGVWNSQCLDDIRSYVRAHPADYVFADWSIGRALALELRYRPQSGTTGLLAEGITDDALEAIGPDHVVLRAVGTAITVPDMSDARMARVGRRFDPLATFRDSVGRDAYQLGRLAAP